MNWVIIDLQLDVAAKERRITKQCTRLPSRREMRVVVE